MMPCVPSLFGREDDQRIVAQPEFFQPSHDAPDVVIHPGDKRRVGIHTPYPKFVTALPVSAIFRCPVGVTIFACNRERSSIC
jgi:hypothetical protein